MKLGPVHTGYWSESPRTVESWRTRCLGSHLQRGPALRAWTRPQRRLVPCEIGRWQEVCHNKCFRPIKSDVCHRAAVSALLHADVWKLADAKVIRIVSKSVQMKKILKKIFISSKYWRIFSLWLIGFPPSLSEKRASVDVTLAKHWKKCDNDQHSDFYLFILWDVQSQ